MAVTDLDLCRRFADGTGLSKDEIAHLHAAGFTYPDGTCWMLTEQGRMLIESNRNTGPDDDSYWPTGRVAQPDVVAAQAAINAGLRGALDVQVGGGHYKDLAIQPVEFIEANKLPFLEGCIIKRICRHGTKNGAGAKDLHKIIHEAQLLLQLRYGEQV